MVTDVGAWSLYGQLLDDAERKRHLSMKHVEDLLVAGLKATLPAPGKEAWICAMVSREVGGIRKGNWKGQGEELCSVCFCPGCRFTKPQELMGARLLFH